MNRRTLFLTTAKAALATAFAALRPTGAAQAQPAAATPAGPSSTGRPIGSPAGTRTIPGDVLPPRDLPWGGTANLNAAQSTPWWQPRVVPPEGAPNILLIITDDVGFGAPGTFGGVIPTPNLDRIAQAGLRYTQFHSTALCSPSRAALITGRNHHAVGFGVISELATGFPGYDSFIGRDAATVGEILKQHGYSTAWFGKDHNTPAFQASQAGPFDQWPIGMGFEYFYGFVGGDTSQWQPNLFRNTTEIYPYVGQPGWNLTTAMADDAIAWMKRINALDPAKPFLCYYAPGGTHAPHHPTPEWIRRISDMHLFDDGWNALRERIFANQKRLGVIPADAKLTPWPDDLLKRWEALTADEKKMFIRQVEVYAAYLAYTDEQIGRVIQAVEDMGKLDNTLIIYISGDNGASAEGTLNGTPNEVAMFNGVDVPVADQLKYFYDAWGSDRTYNHMAVAWSWAFDTPFTWTKQVASHFGGTRQGMAIAWPRVIKDKGGIRHQFHHLIDIMPTILEAAGVPAPSMVNGIPQKPVDGVGMAYTFAPANAAAASTRKTQYFEMFGDRALYHEGWIASTKVTRPPWANALDPTNPDPANTVEWELYDLTRDWTQFEDVAAKFPAKLRELQELFWIEAQKNGVMPLDSSTVARLITPKPSLAAGRSEFVWTAPLTGTPNGDAPSILNASYLFSADIEVQAGGEGMIVTQGGRFAGYGFYLLKGRPVFLWNLVDLERVRWQGADPLTPGRHLVEFDFRYDGLGMETLMFNDASGIGRGGTGTLKVDGKPVATRTMARTLPFILQWDENFDVGADTGTPVDDGDYQVPFAFTGTLHKLTLKVDRPVLSEADKQRLMRAHRNNAVSQ